MIPTVEIKMVIFSVNNLLRISFDYKDKVDFGYTFDHAFQNENTAKNGAVRFTIAKNRL